MERGRRNDKEVKVNIEDITLPQIKKVVHSIMTKFYGNESYRHSDLIRKALRKLKCDYSKKAYSRVKLQLRNWIISNNEISKKGNTDSKKGVLSNNSKNQILKSEQKKKINLPFSNNTNKNKKSIDLNSLNEEDNADANKEKQSDDQNDRSCQGTNSQNSEKQSDQNNQVSKPLVPENRVCCCACSCKNKVNSVDDVIIKHELIDLTTDDSVKTEEEDDMYDINAVISQLDDYYMQPSFIYLLHVQ